MESILHLHPTAKGWLLGSQLRSCIDAYADHLKRGGYATTTTHEHMLCLAHLARWMRQSRCEVEELDEAAVGRFLNEHLPDCDCPQPVCRNRRDLSDTCSHLLRVLRDKGVIAKPATEGGPIEEELHGFDAYMNRVRGLAEGTRQDRTRIVRRLLTECFADQPVVISTLQPAGVREFLAKELERRGSTSHASALASALRAYFRYRTACGDQVAPLLGVIASPAHWSLASLPRSLTDEEIERLLASFTPDLPSPRRGYAMVRCALDLGLRSSEIAKLALTDIDWQAGTLRLRRTKSRREDILPLPPTTGEAIAAYLRLERPASVNPAVFVRHMAPYDVPIGPDAVRKAIRLAYRRIGLTHGRTHALRHTLARHLVESGGSIKEVADVLRHRSLNTSLIYAKLDSRSLGAVALPWPGSAT
ncbi:MAG: site-specific integrase [Pseudomonadota bacterium]|nr:site-specific integrase [Pseudomonadota bacterium]